MGISVAYIVFWWVLFATCLFMLILSVFMCRKYHDASLDNCRFMILSYGGFISSTVLCAYGAGNLTYEYLVFKDKISNVEYYLGDVIGESLYGIELTFTYLVFLYKFKIAFQATTYQSPQYVHNIFYVMIGIFLLNRVVYCIWKGFQDFTHYTSVQENDSYATVYFWTEEIIDLCISISMVYLFVSKLFKVAARMKTPINSHELILNIEQKQLIDVITKYTLISVTSVVFTQIQLSFISVLTVVYIYILRIYDDETSYNKHIYGYETCMRISGVIFGLDSVINAGCIFFNFAFTESIYVRVCKSCHSYCKMWATKAIKKKITNEILYDKLLEL
eukprot:105694_1